MYVNAFGEPKPYGFDELMDVISESGLIAPEAIAIIDYQQPDGEPNDFDGYTAEITGEGEDDDGELVDIVINTLGYESKDDLLADLDAAGIKTITE